MDKGPINRRPFRFISRGYPYTLCESTYCGKSHRALLVKFLFKRELALVWKIRGSARPQVEQGGVGKNPVFVKQLFLLNASQHYPLNLQEIKERKYVPDAADVYFIDDG